MSYYFRLAKRTHWFIYMPQNQQLQAPTPYSYRIRKVSYIVMESNATIGSFSRRTQALH